MVYYLKLLYNNYVHAYKYVYVYCKLKTDNSALKRPRVKVCGIMTKLRHKYQFVQG